MSIFKQKNIIGGLLLLATLGLILCSGAFFNFSAATHCMDAEGLTSHARTMAAIENLILPNSQLVFSWFLLLVVYLIIKIPKLLFLPHQPQESLDQFDGSFRAFLYLIGLFRAGIIHPKIY